MLRIGKAIKIQSLLIRNASRKPIRKTPKKSTPNNEISYDSTRSMLNFSKPHLWYPAARRIQRKFVLHCGPTNSGKTFNALQALKASKRGIYLAPLRLLAWEVTETIRAENLRCDLITGQERDIDDDPERLRAKVITATEYNNEDEDEEKDGDDDVYRPEYDYSAFDEVIPHASPSLSPRFNNFINNQYKDQHHIACTIEMGGVYTNNNNNKRHDYFDVAVIDEAQLVGEGQRGWAWTQALLGIPAKEIHLCGSPDMLPIIESLINECNDTIIKTHHYNRLSPLNIGQPIGSYRGTVRPGDCIIAFSRAKVHKLKNIIERQNKNHIPPIKCCVVYGGLPPESRKKQTNLFNNNINNDITKYQVLVATDAIGMGLNLAIKRIIFSSITKYDGKTTRDLKATEIKQIAGRAGRYSVNNNNNNNNNNDDDTGGVVTTLHESDLSHIREGLKHKKFTKYKAGLVPLLSQIELLGLFIDYNISDDTHVEDDENENEDEDEKGIVGASILSRFWNSYYTKKKNPSASALSSSSSSSSSDESVHIPQSISVIERETVDLTSPETILFYFGNVKNFAIELEFYLREKNLLNAKRIKMLEKSIKKQEKRMLGVSITSGSGSGSGSKVREPITITMSKLLKKFRTAVNLDSTGLYHMCDMKDSIALAEVIEYLPIAFHDRYVWVMAPVSTENVTILNAYHVFAKAFAYEGIVKLHVDLQQCEYNYNFNYSVYHKSKTSKSDQHWNTHTKGNANENAKIQSQSPYPRTEEESLEIESYHNIFDIYLWLSLRFGVDIFPDIDKAKSQAIEAARLVNLFLEKGQGNQTGKNKTTTTTTTTTKTSTSASSSISSESNDSGGDEYEYEYDDDDDDDDYEFDDEFDDEYDVSKSSNSTGKYLKAASSLDLGRTSGRNINSSRVRSKSRNRNRIRNRWH
jgi:superfamily II DNA/RNA helicase